MLFFSSDCGVWHTKMFYISNHAMERTTNHKKDDIMTHKDIKKSFSATHPTTGETRHFEAVGFLNEGELPINDDEMFKRVPDAIGEEEGKFLDECFKQDWSQELWSHNLVTAWRHPDRPRSVRCFVRHGHYWAQHGHYWARLWSDPDGLRWNEYDLVVRRCA